MTKEKSRYFTFLLYPESIPEEWEMKLELLGLPIAISPLHDLDVTEKKLGEMSKEEQEVIKNGGIVYKKPHYHVIYVANNPVTSHSVRMRIKRALGDKSIAKVQIVQTSMVNTYLYLTHESKDAIAKKKHVYDKKDIKLLNNFDIDRYVTLDEAEKNEILDTVVGLILQHGFENIVDFMDFYSVHADDYVLPNKRLMNSILKSNTGFLRLFFDGNYQRHQKIMAQEKESKQKGSKK